MPTVSAIDGSTPSSMTPGSPTGSYVLSGFDTVNMGNGRINFNLPLLKLPGRGDTQVTLNLPIQTLNGVNWQIRTQPYPVGSCGPNGCTYNYRYQPTSFDWNLYPPGFGTASLVQRASGDFCSSTTTNNTTLSFWTNSLTRLSFTEPDGTEHELWDQTTGGQPEAVVPSPGFARGTTFVSHDGAGIFFTSDSVIYDPPPSTDQNGCHQILAYPMSGNLVLRNGTIYRFDTGRVSSITDRNGNKITYSYAVAGGTNYQGPPSSIVDSFGRTTTIANGYPTTITYPGANGVLETITIVYGQVANLLRDPSDPIPTNVATFFPNIQQNLIPAGFPGFPNVISQVILPNGQRYSFFYNKYGYVARVVLPTGGAYEYDYVFGAYAMRSLSNPLTDPFIYSVMYGLTERRKYLNADATISPQNHQGNLVARTTYNCTASPSTPCSSVNDYDGAGSLLATEHHTINPIVDPANGASYSGWTSGKETRTEHYDANGGGLLRALDTAWEQRDCSTGPPCWFLQAPYNYTLTDGRSPDHDSRKHSEQTTLSDSTASSPEVSLLSYVYDGYNNRLEAKEYAYGAGAPGSLARDTATSYLTGQNYLNRNMISLPSQQTVNDGNGIMQSQTTYTYDGSSVSDCPNIIGHDPNFGTAFQTRGNATSVSRWLHDPSTGQTANPAPTTQFNYDIAGNVVETYDPRNVHLKYQYNDARNTYGVVTNVKSYPILGSTSPEFDSYASYDYSLAKPISTTDINGNTTQYSYVDPLGRLTTITRPDGSQTRFIYTDTPSAVSVATATDLIHPSDGQLQTEIDYDGLGRTINSKLVGVSCVTTTYDGRGRVSTVSNPSTACGSSMVTTTTYDGLNRVRTATAPDGSVTETRYAGPLTLALDSSAQHKTRQTSTDALGRLTQVIENQTTWRGQAVGVNTEPVLATNYTYDTLDDLQIVNQGSQTRTFTYDSLKRLVQATNPENGTISYAYDLSGNLVSRNGGSGKITWGAYDGLNRPTSKAYSLGSVNPPSVTYCYDGLGLNPAAQTCGTIAAATGSVKGRLTGVGTSASTTNFTTFSNRGFILSSKQTTAGTDYTFPGYGYTLTGALSSVTYPSGVQVGYTFDSAGRVNSVTGTFGGSTTNYASNIQYTPFNAIQQATFGNGLVENRAYSADRMQATSITASQGSTTFLSLGYNYCSPGVTSCTTNNGNVQGQTITRPNGNWSQVYTYDSLNRLVSAAESGTGTWSENYGFDAFGNRWVTGLTGLPTLSLETPTAQSWYNGNNQISTWGYDAAGNITHVGSMTRNFNYDVENRQVSATIGGATSTYTYDAEGRRVTKTAGGQTTVYVYDAFGHLTAEYGSTPISGTIYLTSDTLGSTRLTTAGNSTSGASLGQNFDYRPFGEEIGAGWAGRDSTFSTDVYPSAPADPSMRFTGKERDGETGLDFFGARYFSAAQGRFTSPDWSSAPRPVPYGALGDPQTLNLYTYVRNNPLGATDPSGHASCESKAGGNTQEWLKCKGVASEITGSDPQLQLAEGAYASADSRYALFVGPNGSARMDRTGAEPTIGPEFDAVAGGAQLAGAGVLGAIRFALRAASRRLGLEVGADIGIALSRVAIDEALADEARVLHAGRHLVEEGLIEGGTNAAIASGTRAIASEILNKPIASFIERIGAGAGEIPVRLFVGQVEGRVIGVAIADQAVGAVARGTIVTILSIH
jgi:RHS repeat-associated protein